MALEWVYSNLLGGLKQYIRLEKKLAKVKVCTRQMILRELDSYANLNRLLPNKERSG